jgi:uncharacterized protein (DUF1330 family)
LTEDDRCTEEAAVLKAYVIFFVESVHDLARLEEYRRVARPTLQEYGAEFRVVRGRFEVLEGDPVSGVVMLEFASMERARAWYHSPEYQTALKHRLAASSSRTVLCEALA